MKKILFGLYVSSIILLFLYSYTQVDLSLTFSRNPFLRNLIFSFQHIGYFERPLATGFYIGIVTLLFVFYCMFVRLALLRKLEKKQMWIIILFTAGILLFAYNAFSYDLFNYIFDAKIFTHYHENPYLHKALDYPADPMLSFMRWTHRVYPYGPVWLAATIPLSLIGMNIFIVTFLLFKLLAAASYLGSVFFIGKIAEKIKAKNILLPMILFAFNPLVIIESLVSGHNDIVMVYFALSALYLLLQKKYVRAFGLLLLSIGIKFVTVFLVPVFLFVMWQEYAKKKIAWDQVFIVTSLIMILPVVLASLRANFQVWYVLNVLPFAALVSRKAVYVSSMIGSFMLLFEYVPFLYQGDYKEPVPTQMNWILLGAIAISCVTCVFLMVIKTKKPALV